MHNHLFRQTLFMSKIIKIFYFFFSLKVPPEQPHSSMGFNVCIPHCVFPQYHSCKIFTLRNRILTASTAQWNTAQWREFSTFQWNNCNPCIAQMWTWGNLQLNTTILYLLLCRCNTKSPLLIKTWKSHFSDMVSNTLNECSNVLVNKALPQWMHKLIAKKANPTQ